MSEDRQDRPKSDGNWEVIIAGDDGRLYKFGQQELAAYEVPREVVESPHFETVRRQLRHGIVSSIIPESRGFVACYVLNLASLRTVEESDPWKDRFSEE